MELAIKAVFPNTIHRWCKWHIFYKAKEHIGPNLFSKTSDFKDKFHRVLNHIRTIDEFEGAWNSLIAEYDLHSNTWLQDVWDKRDRWAPPYFKDFFFAKMTTTQRSECMNHVLKAYVSPSSTMHNFVKQYDKFIADRIAAEDKLEFDTSKVHLYYNTNIPFPFLNEIHYHTSCRCHFSYSQDARQPRCGSPIERKAAKVYTDTMFAKFSDQVYMSASYFVQEIRDDGTYITVHMDCDTRENWSKLEFPVHVNEDEEEYRCICRLFEHMGILCSHIIRV